MKQRSTLILFMLFAFVVLLTNETKAQQQSPLDIALRHLEANREALNLTEADITNVSVSDLYTSRHNGLTHVYLKQEHQGIPVEQAISNINVLPDGQVLNMGNRFVAALQSRVNTTVPNISAADAVQVVFQQFQKKSNVPLELQEKVNDRHFIFKEDGIALQPIEVRLVYQVMEDKSVHLAWRVELYELSATNWWNVKVDAQDGTVLAHQNQVIHCDFGHKNDCPEEVSNKTSKGISSVAAVPVKQQNSILANTYNVYPLPIESPNHGSRELLTDPSDDTASPFGWHDTDGTAGAEFTITRGNNVHAYQDIFGRNNSVGDEPDGGASLDFDFPLDLGPNRPYTQIAPAVVNLFYWNNVMHDLWYQYGFDEASGNFQQNNYGNGGEDGDYVRAEALDGSGTNNANFGSNADGSSARMQMYIWTDDPLPTPEPDSITILEPMSVAGRYEMVAGGFGAPLPLTPLVGKVVLADDGVDPGSNACEDLINGSELSGNIAMIDRGDCEFGAKSLKAENAGAIAVIICNNDATASFPMGAGAVGNQVTIPAVMMSLQDCNEIKMGFPDLMVELKGSYEIPLPGPNGLDGDLDNGIIIHEYTHGISNRLTGGPSTGGCLSGFEQAGEGWSDWFAMVMLTTENNTAEQRRGMGTYALAEPTNGDGIRSFPYSRDMNTNPHTYASINSEAVPHGVGSVWAVMIWDLYWNLIDEYGFDKDFYQGTKGNNIAMQLVLDGLKIQPCNPNFIDARDAIIAADIANNGGANVCLIWETFARRGLGFDAQAGGVEAFNLPPSCSQTLKVNKTAVSEIDAGGIITYTIEVINDTPGLLNDISISDQLPQGTTYVPNSSTCPNSTVTNGVLNINLGSLMNGTTATCTYQLQVADNPFSITLLKDGVEAGTANWSTSAPIGAVNWKTSPNSYEGATAWFAEDIATVSDQYLTLAEPIALNGANPTLSFWHHYNTEATWDGGVVEISKDNGTTWQDLGTEMTLNGYNSTIQTNVDSPISQRDAFSGNSGGYIQTLINLSSYSGQSVIFRFRLGCDAAEGGEGWYVDNVQLFDSFYSITNTACVTNSGQQVCSEVTTIVNGEATTGVLDATEQLAVSVFPNPAEEVVYVSIKGAVQGTATVNLRSVDGRLVLSKTLTQTGNTFSLDLSTLNPGIHLLEVQTANAKVIRKLVIQ